MGRSQAFPSYLPRWYLGNLAAGEKMKIDLCMPIWRAPISPEILKAVVNLIKMEEFDINLLIELGFQTAQARNNLIKRSTGDYVLFMDSDNVITPKDLKKLVEDDKEIVSGVYFHRGFPYLPVVYEYDTNATGFINSNKIFKGLKRIDGAGLGACLIKKSVFEKLRKPYFEFNAFGNGSTEDFDFFEKCRKSGVELWADWDVPIGHIGEYIYSISDFNRMKNNQKRIKEKLFHDKN